MPRDPRNFWRSNQIPAAYFPAAYFCTAYFYFPLTLDFLPQPVQLFNPAAYLYFRGLYLSRWHWIPGGAGIQAGIVFLSRGLFPPRHFLFLPTHGIAGDRQ